MTKSIMTPEQLHIISLNGGGTFALLRPSPVAMPYEILVDTAPYITDGYFVATKPLIANPIPEREFCDNFINSGDLNAVVSRTVSGFVGFWFNKDNNCWYIDEVAHYDYLEYAMNTARAYDQIAIWDISNRREIRVIPG
jgi:hypothetical protein